MPPLSFPDKRAALLLDTDLAKETETAADGFYRILLLPVGKYSVAVHASGF